MPVGIVKGRGEEEEKRALHERWDALSLLSYPRRWISGPTDRPTERRRRGGDVVQQSNSILESSFFPHTEAMEGKRGAPHKKTEDGREGSGHIFCSEGSGLRPSETGKGHCVF